MLRLFVLFLALASQISPAVAAQKQNVLLIHSYHIGMPWTDAQQQGFADTLSESGLKIDLHVEYLDSLRYRDKAQAIREDLLRTLHTKFTDNPPDVIAVTDNNALDFVLDARQQLAPGVPVVFCGINGLDPDIRSRHQNLTGVAEEASFKETLEIMEQLLPGRRVLILGEKSPTFQGNFASLRNANEQLRTPAQLEVFDDPVLSHIEEKVRLAGPDTAIFILNRPRYDNGEPIDSAVAVRAISSASKQPVFSAWDYMFGYGIVGGKLTSGEAHGQTAAQQVIRILKGEAADSIPIEWESPNRYFFDYEQLLRFGLEDAPLPEGSTVINRPLSLFVLYRNTVLVTAGVLALLLLFSIRLLVLNKSLRESKNLLHNIVDNIPVMVFLKRASDLSFVLFNRCGETLIGHKREELLGHHDYDFFPKEQAEFFISKDREVLQRTDVLDIAEEPIETPDGTRILHTRKLALRDRDGHPIYLLGISEDITEQRLREDELKRYRDHLEETVEERTEELRMARDAAEAANRAKSVFLANMSHELRTPLNAILGFSQLMRQDQTLSPGQRESLDTINISGEHLLKLINDVLEIAKIEAGKLQLEIAAFDLHELVREVADMMRLRAQQKGLQLTLDQSSRFPRYITGDEARLRQILVNLVSNAVKFTEKGNITIRLRTKNNAAQHLIIEIEDTGQGISETDQQRLFKPFEQLPTAVPHGGTGLGLAIVRQFVQLMKGSISVESTPGKGTLFRVDLPLDAAEETDIAHLSSEHHGDVIGLAPGQPSYRILIAEDQHDNQLLLVKLMTDIGMEVKTADDGEECVRLFEEWRPDLIWMDRRMPIIDGEEATRRIRKLPGGDKVKIVAVTASAFTEEQEKIVAAGMDGFVSKPYRFSEIYECIVQQLGVELRYRETTREATRALANLTPEMLAGLSDELRMALREALDTLDSERITEVINRISEEDHTLAQTLRNLAENYDYPTIINALDG